MKNYLLTFLIFITGGLSAQTVDSLSINSNTSDSLKTAVRDSITANSTESESNKYDVDAVIFANANDSLSFDVKNKKMYLYGKGELKYQTSELKSADITVDFTTNTLSAQGKPDTAKASERKLIDTPVLSEAGEVYEGTTLKYNFKTQQGYISLAKNTDKDKSYQGEKVKKVDKQTYFVEDGLYTTCDSDTPHTYFTASKMKVMQNDKIVANWIFMHIGGVPVPIPLPFAVLPNQSGRRSGIIVPTYGFNSQQGHTFRNLGYFWAISDYMDLMVGADLYTTGGYRYRTRYRYKKRYAYTGNLTGEYSRLFSGGEQGDPSFQDKLNWNISLRHNQDINPTTSFNANLSFMSNEFLQNNTRSYNDYTTQNVTSNATFSKRWDESGNSLTIGYSRNQNLENGNITEVLPSVNFNMSQKYPFKREGVAKKDQAWYEYIGFNYSSRFNNKRTKTSYTEIIPAEVDSLAPDTINGYNREIRGGIQHNFTLNASPKVGYFNISPSIGYTEKWYNKRLKVDYEEVQDGDSTVYERVESDVKEINFVRTFDFRISASTKLYGVAQPEILGIKAFRHTLTPSISYQYQPDFSKNFWGYYDEVYNPETNQYEEYDKYRDGIFGGSGSGERQSINFSLGNLFEMKTEKDPTDTSSQEKKIQLLNLSASTGYNFVADSLRLSDLRLSFRTQIGNLFSFNGSSSYSFYDYALSGTSTSSYANTIDKFLVSEGRGILRLRNLSLNVSTTLSGDKIAGEERDGRNKKRNEQADTDNDIADIDDNRGYLEDDKEVSDFTIPWNLSLNFNYNLNKNNPDKPIITSNAGVNLSLSLSQNWKLTFRGNYDFEKRKLNAPQITVYRDLHCWEMNFIWNPIGRWRGFRFEIRMKAPELRDLKLTKTKDIYSGF